MTESSQLMTDPAATETDLSPRERGFVARIMAKYPGGRHTGADLYRSVAIVSGLILLAHLVERLVPAWTAWWLPLLIIYPPAVYLFTRYRKFSIFRSCVISKLGARLSRYEPLAPGRPPERPHGSSRPVL